MRKALGKGLEALFPGPVASPGPSTELRVPLSDIVPNPQQPRHRFDGDALDGLVESIRLHGLLQPLVVRRVAGRYELIAGERRLRAATLAGLDSVPVVVRDAEPGERLELALIENIQREDLTPLEEAEAYRRLVDEYGLTQEEVAVRVGKSRPAVTNALRLLGLPDAVKARLASGELSAAHARAVLSVEGERAQVEFARDLVDQRLSKTDAERLAAARRARPSKRAARTPPADIHLHALGEELMRGFGTRVRITRRARGGSIEIEFYSDSELERLVERLRSAIAVRV